MKIMKHIKTKTNCNKQVAKSRIVRVNLKETEVGQHAVERLWKDDSCAPVH